MQTKVMVRAQAVGGKFLGMGVDSTPAPALVVLKDNVQVATATFSTGNSGVVSTSRSDENTLPICVDGQQGASPIYVPGTYYLAPSDDPAPDSYAPVTLPLTDEKESYTFVVTAYNSDVNSPTSMTRATCDMAIDSTTTEVVVPIPGLRVTGISATQEGIRMSIAMMCGCMITPRNWMPPAGKKVEPYWPEYEFDVQLEYDGPVSGEANLVCTAPSQFETQRVLFPPGKYAITVFASQRTVRQNVNKVQTTVIVS